jgi:hypothetical protein
VLVGVFVGVFVGVSVGVFVGVSVAVLVGVLVAVGVFVFVGVAVAASTSVVMVTELSDSTNSGIELNGSTTAVLLTEPADGIVPVMVMVAVAPAPVPNGPRSQSSWPPGLPPTMAHAPRLVLKPVMVKLAGGVSIMRTAWRPVPAEPTLLTTMV